MSEGKFTIRKLRRVPKVVVREEENCYLLINRTSGKVLVINKIGFEIWHLLENLTVEDIVKELTRKYQIAPASCKEQVEKFVEKLLRNSFLTL
ncbi:MAG: PqqD family protein [Candidatus Jordarchaeaceae archaeon]